MTDIIWGTVTKVIANNKFEINVTHQKDENTNSYDDNDIVVFTESPNMLVSRKNNNPPIGMHGYNPKTNTDMEGIFLAYGNKIKPMNISKVKQVDIAPTILSLLDVEIPKYMEGNEIQLN